MDKNTQDLASAIKNTFAPDSGGVIYPYVAKKTWNSVYRFEARLDTPVDPAILSRAVQAMHGRFPTFFVQIIKEKSVYKLYTVPYEDIVQPVGNYICGPFLVGEEGRPLIRIMYNGCTIIFEAFHTVSDGHGAMEFFRSLVARYFIEAGYVFPLGDIRSCDDEPGAEEAEDAFLSVPKGPGGGGGIAKIGSFAYQHGKDDKKVHLTVTDLAMPFDQLHDLAKDHNTTVGVMLTSVFMWALVTSQDVPSGREIRISVPVDMRKYFPSLTLRNFSLYIIVGIRPDEKKWDFDSIVESIAAQFKEKLNALDFQDMANSNVKSLASVFFRRTPVPLKRAILRFGYDYLGERLFTTTLSNIGRIELPEQIMEHIEDVRFVLGQTMVSRINAIAYTFKDTSRVILTSDVSNMIVQELYASKLRDFGIDVKKLYE